MLQYFGERSTWMVLALLLCAAPGAAIQFNFQQAPGMPQEAVDGFVRAGELWQDLLSDDIIVNLSIGYEQLPLGVLGSTGSQRITVSYDDFVTAIGAQPASDDDTSATGALQAPPAFELVMNRTSNNPHGSGSAQIFLDNDGDANNTTLRLTRANAKALGLLARDASESDASITFSSDFNWDFEPDDGITANHFNFVFVAAHEIGHMLGFTSGVDILDGNSPPHNGPFPDDAFTWVNAADLFRFSVESLQNGAGINDWAADNRPKTFSIDGGATSIGEFSRGRNFGDSQQASHWLDNQGLGLMDPTVAPGEVSQITDLDRRFFDVVGYELGTVEPIVSTEADLAVSLTASLEISYTVVVENQGPDAVVGANVANQAPANLGNAQWTCAAANGASCTPSGSGHINDIVDLPVGSSVTYTLTGTVQGLQNVASVAPPTGVSDPNPDNNSTGGSP